MKTFEAFLVLLRDGSSLKKFSLKGGTVDIFVASSTLMRDLGSPVAEACNTNYLGKPALLIHAPKFPLGVLIWGAQLTDPQGNALAGQESRTELCSLVPAIEE